ncbi:flagellar type III secretion system pore protein FliP [Endozoicomonadaceae bacterium StTr2]
MRTVSLLKKTGISLILMLLPVAAWAVDIPLFSVADAGEAQEYSTSLQIILLLSALSFLPALLLACTGFARIIVVLSLLRQAMGLQQTPPNPVLVGLALFLTFYVMSPVWTTIYDQAITPWAEEQITFQEAAERASKPVKAFMLRQTREQDLVRLYDAASMTPAAELEDTPFAVLVPAFLISELKTAFQIGFMIFIPFLVIDLVVASILMAMGMMMLSPLVISLPFKLMLFVLVDGWGMTIGTLAASFNTFQ